ncbi:MULTISPECIES: hypothetical protein [unclassified Flavobacterium]|nr:MULTISPECIES: hypothetical protein [unclassified Flavobacterium]
MNYKFLTILLKIKPKTIKNPAKNPPKRMPLAFPNPSFAKGKIGQSMI